MKSKERVHIGAVCIIGVALICILLPLGNLNGIFDYKGERIELKENDIGSGVFIKTNNVVLDNFGLLHSSLFAFAEAALLFDIMRVGQFDS